MSLTFASSPYVFISLGKACVVIGWTLKKTQKCQNEKSMNEGGCWKDYLHNRGLLKAHFLQFRRAWSQKIFL